MKIGKNLGRVTREMHRFAREARGNATMLFAFGMPMIVGGGGFAIDFAQAYLWKRELQYAADQAAIAAAWELAGNLNSTSYKDKALLEFAANEMVTKDFNTTPTVQLSNYAGKIGNAVTVTVSATKLLPFSSYFTSNPTTVFVRSQAAFTGGAVTTQCLIAVDGSDGGAVKINGDSLFTAGCGIAALSTSEKICVEWNADGSCMTWEGEDAIEVNGNPTIDAGTIAAAGTIDDDLNDLTDDIIIENAANLEDPFKDLDAPVDKVTNKGSYACKDTGKTEYLVDEYGNYVLDAFGNKIPIVKELGVAKPGIFTNGLSVQCDTTFNSGIYVIKGGTLSISGNYNVLGSDIMFILTDGAGLKINGNSKVGAPKQVNLQGISQFTLEKYGVPSDQAAKMAGMLIFEDKNSPGNNPTGEGLGNFFNGTNQTWISGAVYLSKSTLSLAGTAKVANQCLTIVANKVILTGTMDMTDFCPEGQTHETTIIYGTVKLVA